MTGLLLSTFLIAIVPCDKALEILGRISSEPTHAKAAAQFIADLEALRSSSLRSEMRVDVNEIKTMALEGGRKMIEYRPKSQPGLTIKFFIEGSEQRGFAGVRIRMERTSYDEIFVGSRFATKLETPWTVSYEIQDPALAFQLAQTYELVQARARNNQTEIDAFYARQGGGGGRIGLRLSGDRADTNTQEFRLPTLFDALGSAKSVAQNTPVTPRPKAMSAEDFSKSLQSSEGGAGIVGDFRDSVVRAEFQWTRAYRNHVTGADEKTKTPLLELQVQSLNRGQSHATVVDQLVKDAKAAARKALEADPELTQVTVRFKGVEDIRMTRDSHTYDWRLPHPDDLKSGVFPIASALHQNGYHPTPNERRDATHTWSFVEKR